MFGHSFVAWHHVRCVRALGPTLVPAGAGAEVRGMSQLPPADQLRVRQAFGLAVESGPGGAETDRQADRETRSLDRGRHLSHATVYYLPGCRGVVDGVGAVARGVGALEPVPVVPEPARGTQQRRRRRGLLGGRRERRRR